MIVSIVVIKGGLGNQMFCYAFFLSLKRKNKALYLLNIEDGVFVHNGLEIFRIFHCRGAWRYRLLGILHIIKPNFWANYKEIKESKEFTFDKKIFQEQHYNTIYDGYWQNEKYFSDITKNIKDSFKFKKHKLSHKSIQLAKELRTNNSVAIHIRRGDYINLEWYTCTIDYYVNAISYIKQKTKNPVFYFFSDDISWCKKHFCEDNYKFIDFNKGFNSWQDLYLMTQCKHNIIANSTFSWWGAWLNSNPNKIVIAPFQWIKNKENSSQIISKDWVTI